MRYLVLSDLHGGSEQTKVALSFFSKMHADVLVLLGDLLNHGPRNRLPSTYEPPMVATLLNAFAQRIIAVRGNCDSEVDSMVFNFPCNAPYALIYQKNSEGLAKIFLTHGHLYDPLVEEDIIKMGLEPGDIILSGHTHVSGIFRGANGVINVNPGSTTLPKKGSAAGFALLDDRSVNVYNLEGELLFEQKLLYKRTVG